MYEIVYQEIDQNMSFSEPSIDYDRLDIILLLQEQLLLFIVKYQEQSSIPVGFWLLLDWLNHMSYKL